MVCLAVVIRDILLCSYSPGGATDRVRYLGMICATFIYIGLHILLCSYSPEGATDRVRYLGIICATLYT